MTHCRAIELAAEEDSKKTKRKEDNRRMVKYVHREREVLTGACLMVKLIFK